MIGRLTAFLARMDARAWRSLAVSLALFGAVALVFLFGAKVLGLSGPVAARRWLSLARGPWALPAAIGAFAALAFLGVPQFILIAAAVVAFGPGLGSLYSWVGAMASALIGFWLGWAAGVDRLGGFGLGGVGRLRSLLTRNGFLTSLVVRLVPFAPFLVVNMAAGAARISLLDFVAGTAIGIIPKILLTAFAGGAAVGTVRGVGADALIGLGLAVVAWLATTQLARGWLDRRRPKDSNALDR